MTMHAQPIHALVPSVGPFVGDVPEDRHVERVEGVRSPPLIPGATEMDFAATIAARRPPRPVGGDLPPVRRQARTRTGAVPDPHLRHLDRLAMAVPEMPRGRLGRMVARHAPNCAAPNRAPFLPLRGRSARLVHKSLGCG